MLPRCRAVYGGYIAWRCLTDERDLSSGPGAASPRPLLDVHRAGRTGGRLSGSRPDGSREPGRRQYNVVWYHPVAADDLPRLLTDDAGRVHEGGIPPSLVRQSVRDEMVRPRAGRTWHRSSPRRSTRARLFFFQPIVDLEAPRLVFGRVVLIGDAGSVARPHTAMGVPKAAGDALALAALWRARHARQRISPGSNTPVCGAHRAVVGHWPGARRLPRVADRAAGRTRHARTGTRPARACSLETAAPIDYRPLERDPLAGALGAQSLQPKAGSRCSAAPHGSMRPSKCSGHARSSEFIDRVALLPTHKKARAGTLRDLELVQFDTGRPKRTDRGS